MKQVQIRNIKPDTVFYYRENNGADSGKLPLMEALFLGHFHSPDGHWYIARPLSSGHDPSKLVWFDDDYDAYLLEES
jgi:hypothetical protein